MLRVVRSVKDAEQVVSELSASVSKIGLDCEGVRLGRFGKLSLLQIATPDKFVLVDALNEDTVRALSPLFSSREMVKVMHDCREDSAALLHQFDIKLRGVYDTQVARLLQQRNQGVKLHQESYSELTRKILGRSSQLPDMKERMMEDAFLWHRRPLTSDLVKYAIEGVEFLLPLSQKMEPELSAVGISESHVVDASEKWTEYASINTEISSAPEAWKLGTPLLGMVAAINDKGVYFKLNLGVTGVCCTPSAMKRMLIGTTSFPPVQVGDTVELAVSGASVDGKIIYVDRRDPDWEFFDFLRRPNQRKKATISQEYRHEPSLVGDQDVDPLLRRGLGPDGEIDSDDEDSVDHDPILTQKPSS